MAAYTFPWMQGHALLPLAVCGVTGEALLMGIFPTAHGRDAQSDSGVETLCTGKA